MIFDEDATTQQPPPPPQQQNGFLSLAALGVL